MLHATKNGKMSIGNTFDRMRHKEDKKSCCEGRNKLASAGMNKAARMFAKKV